MNALAPTTQLSIGELIRLAAVDTAFYAKTFFPKTMRVPSPPIHKEMDAVLENPNNRYVSLQWFRGSAKTTKLRIFTSKRIAYGISHTIFFVGASEDHASRSVRWIRNAVERNTFWATTFGLRKGGKWTDTELEIIHGIDERPIWLLGAGITGNVRGINFEDYRPDLIVLDDPITDEGASTLEQREKTDNLILSAIKDSLSREEPTAKMVMLQTPIHPEDSSARTKDDPQFVFRSLGCWTEETKDLPVDEQVSVWPELFKTEDLRLEKKAAIARNKYSLFAREMECRLVSPELATFRPTWLRRYDEPQTSKGFQTILSIDPVPPPTKTQMAKQLRGKDSEAHVVSGRKNGEYWVLETRESTGHQPNYTTATAIELALKWRVTKIRLLAIGYEVVIEGALRNEFIRRGMFWPIEIVPLRNQTKFDRISTQLSGITSSGLVWVRSSMTTLLQQFEEYGPTYTGHDDVLEAAADSLSALVNPYFEGVSEDDRDLDDPYSRDFTYRRIAP